MSRVLVVPYDARWPQIFEDLCAFIWPAVSDLALSIEHVGSTAVPGLDAKPIIDMSIVVATRADVSAAVERLAILGYVHRGDLGVADREAFHRPSHLPDHHPYVCPQDSVALANHITVRDYLRRHPDAAAEYGALKRRLAERFPDDMDAYNDGKTDLLLRVLDVAGLDRDALEAIERLNRKRE